MKISKPDAVTKAKVLVFSPPGHGKTYFLGTADDDERTSPCLFLDFEGGLQTLVGRDIDVATIRDWSDYNEAYALLADPKSPYKSVAIDSISETNIFALLKILEDDKIKRPDPDLAGQQDYGKSLVQMRRFIRSFRDLPIHVFMSALAKDDVESRVGTVKKPAMSGQMADELPGIMDVVAYLALEEQEGELQRLLLLHSWPKFRVKARTPMGIVIPSEILNPTVTSLLDVLGF